jgi:hypothetical protein
VDAVAIQRRTMPGIEHGAVFQGGHCQDDSLPGRGPARQRARYLDGNGLEVFRDFLLLGRIWDGFGAAAVEDKAPARVCHLAWERRHEN